MLVDHLVHQITCGHQPCSPNSITRSNPTSSPDKRHTRKHLHLIPSRCKTKNPLHLELSTTQQQAYSFSQYVFFSLCNHDDDDLLPAAGGSHRATVVWPMLVFAWLGALKLLNAFYPTHGT